MPGNAGDVGSIPGLGRFHMLWGNWACAPQILGLHAATTEIWALQLESSPCSLQLEKVCTQQWRLSAAKDKEINFKNLKKMFPVTLVAGRQMCSSIKDCYTRRRVSDLIFSRELWNPDFMLNHFLVVLDNEFNFSSLKCHVDQMKHSWGYRVTGPIAQMGELRFRAGQLALRSDSLQTLFFPKSTS